MTPTTAQTIALRAVTFLAADERLKDFLNDSGLDICSFRERLGEAGLLSAFLDFFMRDPAIFSQFCEVEHISEDDVHNAWQALTPSNTGEA